MIRINEVIVVEGRYDKNKLHQLFDAVIVETGGFAIFNDAEKTRLLRRMARERGLLILTDSDGAGFQIRSYLRGAIGEGRVLHAYIPDLYGKERRKRSPSKEGKLGVEGIPDHIILEAVRRASVKDIDITDSATRKITKADFYEAGLSGKADSAARRAALLKKLDLPERMGANALLEFINAFLEPEAFDALVKEQAMPAK